MNSPVIPTQLLAKSTRKGRPPLCLQQHLLDTEESGIFLFDPSSRWGQNWAKFFQLSLEQQKSFLLNLRVAALFHDIGKANEEFLKAVSSPSFIPQPLRHEHLSALLLHHPEIRCWLRKNPLLDTEVITAAVLSHHLKASSVGAWQWCKLSEGLDDKVFLFFGHPEISSTLAHIACIANLPLPPALTNAYWKEGAEPWEKILKEGKETAIKFHRNIKKDKERKRFLLAVKSGLIVADSVASGLVREGKSIKDWLVDVTRRPPIKGETVESDILAPRIARIDEQYAATRGPFKYHEFQNLAACQPRRTLLLAACGAGKSMAAWRWAQARLDQHDLGCVIFLYPTRGTATEGFRDYVGPAPESALVHGTSTYEIEAIQSNPREELSKKQLGLTEEEQRLFALGYWSKRFFSATVDQFLGFMTHNYMSLCLLPLLADSVLIVDEVHSFDPQMFAALEHFLTNFDLPVLAMTATLTPDRRRRLEAVGLKIFPDDTERATLKDLDRLERHPRYKIGFKPMHEEGKQQALRLAMQAYREGRRVLWVVNRVAECQAIVQQLAREGIDALCYHSRFKLKDRQELHKKTIDAFQQKDVSALAVTTQVCEMSLDLDADVLISELAPPSALVQRLGRANRHLAQGLEFRAEVLLYSPEKAAPYEKEEIEEAKRFLTPFLGCTAVSQRDLAQALERCQSRELLADQDGPSFLSSGYYAVASSFRDTDDFSVPCILDNELEIVKDLLQQKKSYEGYLVPVPRSEPLEAPINGIPRHLRIAPADRYHPSTGYATK
jgi:CRISPR-associated endonuclease/helicase Cas3